MPEREKGELKLAVRNQLLRGWTHTPRTGGLHGAGGRVFRFSEDHLRARALLG